VTSNRKIQANRANARLSTGAKTSHGRACSARNAYRHGLSLSTHFDPVLSEEVETLARQIAGPGADAEMLVLTRRIAEAQIDVGRVRNARRQLLSQTLRDPDYDSEARKRQKDALVRRCARVAGPLTPIPDGVVGFLDSKPEGPSKFATILMDKARQLLAMDRYERRALSRRKFAIRDFDEARSKPMS
jgi:hypothetical protein